MLHNFIQYEILFYRLCDRLDILGMEIVTILLYCRHKNRYLSLLPINYKYIYLLFLSKYIIYLKIFNDFNTEK